MRRGDPERCSLYKYEKYTEFNSLIEIKSEQGISCVIQQELHPHCNKVKRDTIHW